MKAVTGFCLTLSVALLAGCVTPPERDYANYRAHFPRSILVLPPLNESSDIKGTYSTLASVSYPIAEMGYYVFPVVLADQMLKENGLPTPGEMHQAPLERLRSVFGADAVLYITLKEYGTQYLVFDSVTKVRAQAKLVDTATGTLLWSGTLFAQRNTNNSNSGLLGALISAAVQQVISSSTDEARQVARAANLQLMREGSGLLRGLRHPQYGQKP